MDRRNSERIVLISACLLSLPFGVSAGLPAQSGLSPFLAPGEVPHSRQLSSLPVFRNPPVAIHDLTAGLNANAAALPHVPPERISAGDRPISWRLLVPNILHDQVTELRFPTRLARGKHWVPTAVVVGATVGLVALDPYDAAYFRRNPRRFEAFNDAFASFNTETAALSFPLFFYMGGLIRGHSYAQHTSLLAAESIADTAILTDIMKTIDGRLRPADISPNGNFRDTWFKARGTIVNRGSFPSGHASLAFTVATVFSDRYRNHRWVPWAAYGAATFIGLSRITLSAHFPSDVFFGAVMGYAVAHYVVLRR
jgi:membrane-associated phospholipid phosphatase